MNQSGNNSNIILFDGVCNFCNSSVNFILERDRHGKFLFAPLQSEKGKELLREYGLPVSDDPHSVILIKNGKVYQQSSASIEVLRILGGVYAMVVLFKIIPSGIRNFIYRIIAKNRYRWFGKKESCMVPGPEIKNRFLG